MRQFLCWLWCAPLLAALQDRMIAAGAAAGRPLLIVLGGASALMLCFLVSAFNREHGGRLQEEIGALERLRERAA